MVYIKQSILFTVLNIFCLTTWAMTGSSGGSSSSGSSSGSGSGSSSGTTTPIDTSKMVLCSTSQTASTVNQKAEKLSNYCSYAGRYQLKPSWNSDGDVDDAGVTTQGKQLLAYDSFKEIIDGKLLTAAVPATETTPEVPEVRADTIHSQGYRLPSLNELLSLININVAAPAATSPTNLFNNNHVLNAWFKIGISTGLGDYYSGYVATSTFDPDSTHVYVFDIQTREILKIDPEASATKPLYVLGFSDYFQIISKKNPNKCVQFNSHGNRLDFVTCDPSNLLQRWRFESNRFINQYRSETMVGDLLGFCMDHGTQYDTSDSGVSKANGYKCNHDDGTVNETNNFKYKINDEDELLLNQFVRIKAIDENIYLGIHSGVLKTPYLHLIDSDAAFWLLQY